MTQVLTFPIQVSRFAILRMLGPMIFIAELMVAGSLFFMLQRVNVDPPFVKYLVPGFLAASGVIVPAILVLTQKPADITINRTSLTVKPISVMGFGGGVPVNRSITEFSEIKVTKLPTKGGYVYRIMFHGKDGKQNVVFNPPANAAVHDYAQQLGTTLNLKVTDNA